MDQNDRFAGTPPNSQSRPGATWGARPAGQANPSAGAAQGGSGFGPAAGQAAAPRAQQSAQSHQATQAQELEALNREREQITLDRAKAEAEQARSSEDWERLSQELREHFGTDDLDAIEAELNARDQRNEDNVATFRQELAVAKREVQEALRQQEEARRL